jgi:hypothetical protein
MNVTLAATYHDPAGRLYDQMVHMLPVLSGIFDGLALRASHAAYPRSLALLSSAGARISQETSRTAGMPQLGAARREALQLALQGPHPAILCCDLDRALHWAEWYPEELETVAGRLGDHDFTILGRTPRAFDSHPRTQRDTETIVNRVFAAFSGHAWDVLSGARGLSRRAAEALLAGCPDPEFSVDVSWPLFLERAGGYTLGYLEAEGLEFETADRYGDEVARAGGPAPWKAQLDADPRRWLHRLDLARVEIAGLLPFLPGEGK